MINGVPVIVRCILSLIEGGIRKFFVVLDIESSDVKRCVDTHPLLLDYLRHSNEGWDWG